MPPVRDKRSKGERLGAFMDQRPDASGVLDQWRAGLEPEQGWTYGTMPWMPFRSREGADGKVEMEPALPTSLRDIAKGTLDLIQGRTAPEGIESSTGGSRGVLTHDALETLMLPAMGGIGAKPNALQLNTFAGERGASRLDALRGKPGGFTREGEEPGLIQRLQQAKQLQEDGHHPEDVFRDTGWFQGQDGKWRFEIDDSKAQIAGPGVRENTIEPGHVAIAGRKNGMPSFLPEVYQHPELYNAYPEMAAVRVHNLPTEELARGTKGSYMPVSQTFHVAPDTPKELMRTMVHEGQHYVQRQEGFEGGANMSQWLPTNYDELKYFNNHANERLNAIAETAGIDPNRIAMALEHTSGGTKPATIERYGETLDQLHRTGLLEPYMKQYEQTASIRRAHDSALDTYARNAGEVEARTAEARMDYDPAMRRQVPPRRDEPVSPEFQWHGPEQRPSSSPYELEPVDFNPFEGE